MTVPTHLIKVHGPFDSSGSFAHVLDWLANYMEQDEPTSYTSDEVHDALAHLVEAGGARLQAAATIRGGRRKPPSTRIKL